MVRRRAAAPLVAASAALLACTSSTPPSAEGRARDPHRRLRDPSSSPTPRRSMRPGSDVADRATDCERHGAARHGADGTAPPSTSAPSPTAVVAPRRAARPLRRHPRRGPSAWSSPATCCRTSRWSTRRSSTEAAPPTTSPPDVLRSGAVIGSADLAICHLETPKSHRRAHLRTRTPPTTACRRRSSPGSPPPVSTVARWRRTTSGMSRRHRRDLAAFDAPGSVDAVRSPHAGGGRSAAVRRQRHHGRPPVVHVQLQRNARRQRGAVALELDRSRSHRGRGSRQETARCTVRDPLGPRGAEGVTEVTADQRRLGRADHGQRRRRRHRRPPRPRRAGDRTGQRAVGCLRARQLPQRDERADGLLRDPRPGRPARPSDGHRAARWHVRRRHAAGHSDVRRPQ